ncbi:MAG: PQQ-binding-like beta-propeller repeat protein [Gammaproteobacteria bacterium]|nr:PQQ-binding-like beta-propeller repeat protein [Gammaproteobacteria bacterium]
MKNTFASLILTSLISVLLLACGKATTVDVSDTTSPGTSSTVGGGSGGNSSSGSSGFSGSGSVRRLTTSPAVITFPYNNAIVATNVLRVSGISEKSSQITAIKVNASEAQSDNSFQNWVAEVPLTLGENTLKVEITNANGTKGITSETVTVINKGVLLKNVLDISYLPGSSRALVADSSLRGMYSIDPTTGFGEKIYSYSNNESIYVGRIGAMVREEATGRIIFVDTNEGDLKSIDLGTGDGEIVSSESQAGPNISNYAKRIAYDPESQKAYIADDNGNGIAEVNVRTGERRILSSPSVGAGTHFGSIYDMVVDSSNTRLLVAGYYSGHIIAVDLTSGDRTVLSSGSVGTGPTISPRALAHDADSNRLFVLSGSGSSATIVEVLLSATETTVIGDRVELTGGFSNPADMVMSGDASSLLVSDSNKLVGVAISDGEKTILSSSADGIGTGSNWSSGYGMTASSDGSKVWFGNWYRSVIEVDLETGNRTSKTPPTSTYISDLVYDDVNDRLLTIDWINDELRSYFLADNTSKIIANNQVGRLVLYSVKELAILGEDIIYLDAANNAVAAINRSTGERRFVSNAAYGTGGAFSAPSGLTVNGEVIYVYDSSSQRLVAVDIETGNRTTVSEFDEIGSGESFGANSSLLENDSINGRVFLMEPNENRILAIDISNGNRSVISSDSRGTGDSLLNMTQIHFDQATNQIIAILSYGSKIVSINPVNGNRTTVYATVLGTGPAFSADELELDKVHNRLVGLDKSQAVMFQVSLSAGERTILSGNGVGDGPEFDDLNDFVVDVDANMAYVTDEDYEAIFKVDLDTGNRSIFSGYDYDTGEYVGEGSSFDRPQDIVLDKTHNRLLVSDSGDDVIFAIDLTNGNRTYVYGYIDDEDSVPNDYYWLSNPTALALDEEKGLLYVLDDSEKVLEIDLNAETPNAEIVSGYYYDEITDQDYTIGWGVNFDDIQDLRFDKSTRMLYTVDNDLNAVMSVEPSTGDRDGVVYARRNSIPAFNRPYSMAIDAEDGIVYIGDEYGVHIADRYSGESTSFSVGYPAHFD